MKFLYTILGLLAGAIFVLLLFGVLWVVFTLLSYVPVLMWIVIFFIAFVLPNVCFYYASYVKERVSKAYFWGGLTLTFLFFFMVLSSVLS